MRNTVQAVLLIVFIFSYSSPSAQTAKALLAKSEDYYGQRKYDSALLYAWQAEPLVADSTTRNSKEYAYFTGQFFSMNHEEAGNIDSAAYWYLYSLKMFEAHNDSASYQYGETLTNYGNLLNHQSYYATALPYLEKGSRVLQSYPDNINARLAGINNLANNYNYSGLYARALEMYRKCLDEVKQHPQQVDPRAMGILLQNMGTVSFKIASAKEAEKYFKRSYAAAQKAQDLNTYYEAKNNLGSLYLSQRQTQKADLIFAILYNDKRLQKHTGNNPDDLLAGKYVQAITGYAVVREMQGRYVAAENLYQKALTIARRLTDPRGVLTARGNMAHLYTITGRYHSADSIYEKLFALPPGNSNYDHFSYLKVYMEYCEHLVLLKQFSKAIEKVRSVGDILSADLQHNFPGMAEADQMTYLAGLNQFKNLLLSLVQRQQAATGQAVDYAFNRLLQLKGMILTYQQRRLQSLRTVQNKELTGLVQEWMGLKQKLYNSFSTKTDKTKTDDLEQLARQKEQAIALKTGIPQEQFGDSLAEAIGSHLQPGEVAVEFIRYQQTESLQYLYGAFVVRPNAPALFVPLCRETELLQCFRSSLPGGFDIKQQLKNGQRIFQLVWQPLWKHLPDTGTIYYSPDGLLGYLSPEALPVAGSKYTYLLQQRNLVQLSGIRNLINTGRHSNSPAEAAVLWGNIDCSEAAYEKPAIAFASAGSRERLRSNLPEEIKGLSKNGFVPFSQDELPKLREMIAEKGLTFSVYEKSKATEENFKSDAARFAGLLHISSHGFYATAPADTGAQQQTFNRFAAQVNPLLRCGLILNGGNRAWKGKAPLPNREDGILTGYEIGMMDLSKVNLVVLSACETGLGDIDAGSEGILGLQRAFRLAGVGKMVSSLWNVNAAATEKLMIAFYQQLMAGEVPAKALRNAKLNMLKEKTLPYKWAGFVLVE